MKFEPPLYTSHKSQEDILWANYKYIELDKIQNLKTITQAMLLCSKQMPIHQMFTFTNLKSS